MKKNIFKSFLNHPWFLVIGGAIFSYVLPSIHISITQNISIVKGLYNVGKAIINFIVRFFSFRIPLWILFLVIFGLLSIFILISMIITNKKVLQKWKNYTCEYYGEWLFEWGYTENVWGNTQISNLRPICANCRCDLSVENDTYNFNKRGYLYCPKCSSKFPLLNHNTLEDLEKVIIRNVKTGEYKLIDEKFDVKQ
jgi:hypothetical protein